MAATLSGGGPPLNSKSPSQGFRSTNHQVPVVETQPTILERMILRPADLSEKVAESIKDAEEACAGDPVSGECVAAWDEVEELSAAVSPARRTSRLMTAVLMRIDLQKVSNLWKYNLVATFNLNLDYY